MICKPKPKEPASSPEPPQKRDEPIDVDSEPVDDGPMRPVVTRCPNCDSPHFDEDGDCADCREPKVVEAVSEPVHEPPDDEVTDETPEEPEGAESSGTWLKTYVLSGLEVWRVRYPDAPSCLVGGILESLAATWESELED